ncbi:MAG: hypothetical protein K0R00_7 [Herbinix sp.]|jgi:hypothetical protein|nr:hypothetical protein [Herbinix sp.]
MLRKDDSSMSIAKKDRFINTNLRLALTFQGREVSFPPEAFYYEGNEYIILGKSNKDDLIPINVTDIEMQKIVTMGELGQYICTNIAGDIFDACIYRGEDGEHAFLLAIRTREKPEKQKGAQTTTGKTEDGE